MLSSDHELRDERQPHPRPGANIGSAIGGLTAATIVTLVLVPVLYAIFVLDLKLVKWDVPAAPRPSQESSQGVAHASA